MGSLAFLSPDIIGGILGVSAENSGGRGTISGDFGAMFFTAPARQRLPYFKKNQISYGFQFRFWV